MHTRRTSDKSGTQYRYVYCTVLYGVRCQGVPNLGEDILNIGNRHVDLKSFGITFPSESIRTGSLETMPMKTIFIFSLLFAFVHSFAPVATRKKCSKNRLEARKNSDDSPSKPALAVGAFVEFEEKQRRVHVGKITEVEYKSNGGARYAVESCDGHRFNIADKAVHFSINPPNSPGPANKLYLQFVEAQKASEDELQSQLEISPELLELAWEEALGCEETSGEHKGVTPDQIIQLIHSHAASAIENYKAWRLLQSDLSHVFFKDIKDHGRVTSFKVKARKAVDIAKQAFCNNHADSDLCLV